MPTRTPLQVLGTMQLLRRCGHVALFKVLKGEPAKYRARREVKHGEKNCAACTAVLLKKEKEEGATRRAAKAALVRFPDGATVNAVFDLPNLRWAATLCFSDVVLEAQGQGIHGVLLKLARRYREYLDPTLCSRRDSNPQHDPA